MSLGGFDEEILQDFLTECGELLESLEHDLMALEATPNDADLLNTVFRALHTIKGSASFLTLTQLVSVTHAAETALNAARNGRLSVDRTVMDLLLEAVDLVREHFAQIQAGEPLSEPDAKLIAELTRLGEGGDAASESAPASATEAETPEPPIETGSQTQTEAKTSAETGPLGSSVLPLELDSSKLDLLEFLVTDAEDALGSIGELAVQLKDDASRATACQEIVDLLDALRRTVDFFEFAEMCEVVDALRATATMIEADDHPNVDAPVAIAAAVRLLGEQIDGLKERRRLVWPTSSLIEALAGVAEGREIEAINPEMDAMEALVALGVVHDGQPVAPPATPAPVATATEPAAPDPTTTTSATTSTTAPDKPGEARGAKTAVEQTIRVEVGRLESLMNLVGELVLQKNRVSAVNREIASDPSIPQETRESVAQATSDLDRVTGDIQLAVMRTRMQPLDKLFGKYPRLIRDLAKKTGKQIELVIEGGDTEVDKSVLEELGDPLVHLMRNSADHGLEPPDERAASDKQTTGRITLSASNEGGSVSVRIIDDGRGLPRDRLGAKAVERGLVTEQELAQMSDRDVYRFIFHPGFSTAD
ncbi:MAG: chemotaxis protein CheA, partial [Planctomycetota bacterium]